MMAVDIDSSKELALGNPVLLFERPLAEYSGDLPLPYDVAPDGQRFVMIEEGESEPAVTQLILVQNWVEELKRLVPTEN